MTNEATDERAAAAREQSMSPVPYPSQESVPGGTAQAQRPPEPPRPSTQQPYAQPPYAPQPPAPGLSGGARFAWLLVGLFLGVPGMLLAWLTNLHAPDRERGDAVRFAVVGFVIAVVLGLVALLAFGAVAGTVSVSTGMSSTMPGGGYTYY